jgi:serine/threonine-protein kinase RsbW
MEATPEVAEFWCDRLEMAAMICNFAKYQLCLISPEGFSPEAIEILQQQNVFGASRSQIRLLAQVLSAGEAIPQTSNSKEFEMIVPMGDDTEMIAAHTLEKIARRHNFQPKAITQIKTALVEACINATEHSLSPDRKIYQKFSVDDDKIVITISNRGMKIPTEKIAGMTEQIESENGRRGWGLKLMRTLMDEVKFERVDDGTSISMVKYLNGKSGR